MKGIDKEQVKSQWESYYAAAVLQIEQDGLLQKQTKSHTNGRDVIYRVHPAFGVFEKAAAQLAQFNGWHQGVSDKQLELDF